MSSFIRDKERALLLEVAKRVWPGVDLSITPSGPQNEPADVIEINRRTTFGFEVLYRVRYPAKAALVTLRALTAINEEVNPI